MFPGPDSQKIIGFSQILISDLKPGLPDMSQTWV